LAKTAGTGFAPAISALGNLSIELSNTGFAVKGFLGANTAFPVLDNQSWAAKTVFSSFSPRAGGRCRHEVFI
jgi:hypothetical protein